MAIGPGKYDKICTDVRQELNAKGVILIVIEGDKGSGFSCQAELADTLLFPLLLRSIAREMEQDLTNSKL